MLRKDCMRVCDLIKAFQMLIEERPEVENMKCCIQKDFPFAEGTIHEIVQLYITEDVNREKFICLKDM